MARSVPRFRLLSCALALVAVLPMTAQTSPPAPTFVGVTIQASVTTSAPLGPFTYQYWVSNPASNGAGTWRFDVVVGQAGMSSSVVSSGGWIPGQLVQVPPQTGLVPRAPFIGWATFDGAPVSGTTSGPFAIQSTNRPPAVSEAWIQPWIDPYLDALADSEGGELLPDEVDQITLSYIRKLPTLGPLDATPGTFQHWDRFLSDTQKAGELGWISDAALLSSIVTNLQAARQAAVAQDSTTVNARLQSVIDTIKGATPAQRTEEGYDLVFYNAQYLQQSLPWPCEPKLTLAPDSAAHAVGETHTATATMVNVATGKPIAGNFVRIEVADGPHAGQGLTGTTAADGTFTFTCTGTKVGVDTLMADTGLLSIAQKGAAPKSNSEERREGVADCGANPGTASAPAKVTWEGGADLTVPLFVPPVLMSAPGRTFYIAETTANRGTVAAGPTVTRYYLGTSKPVVPPDPALASAASDSPSTIVVGERTVPPLQPGEQSEVKSVPYVIPPDLPAGTYYLDACADADGRIIETDEENNCASSQLQLLVGANGNRPPDCSKADASPSTLWPPDHKLATLSVTGVTDPDGDPVTVTVTGITQDEPTNGLGDGDQTPDGFGVGTAQAQVRAERSGTGNGRVYAIPFTASDGKGGTCTGTIKVGVPHDKKDTPVDDRQTYDSTK